MVFAAAPLVVPMTLRLSALSLRAIVVLVVSREKGITLVFKNDPLESVQVSSSFDGVESVAGYIQREIEAQLREAFRSDLPSVIHRLSQKWLSGEVKSAVGEGKAKSGFERDAKIQTRTSYVKGDGRGRRGLQSKMSNLSVAAESVSYASDLDTTFSPSRSDRAHSESPRRPRDWGPERLGLATPIKTTSDIAQESGLDAMESYDPTYGFRPAQQSRDFGYESQSEGESDERDEFAEESLFGAGEGSSGKALPRRDGRRGEREDDARFQSTPRRSRFAHGDQSGVTERGGGSTTTLGQRSPVHGSAEFFISGGRSGTSTPNRFRHGHSFSSGAPSLIRNNSLPSLHRLRDDRTPHRKTQSSAYSSHQSYSSDLNATRPISIQSTLASSYSSPASSIITPPVEPSAETLPSFPPKRPTAVELLSCSPSALHDASFTDELPYHVTNTSSTGPIAVLAALAQANQTLSPFTKAHESFTARSEPFVPGNRQDTARKGIFLAGGFGPQDQNIAEKVPIKAKRKRLHRIGAAKLVVPPPLVPFMDDSRRESVSSPGAAGTPLRRSNFSSVGGESGGLASYAPSELSDYFPSFRGFGKNGSAGRKGGFPEADHFF